MQNLTKSTKAKDIKRSWHFIDVKDKITGRVCVEIANWLIGKNKPYFTPNLDCGDYVVVINAKKVKVGGKKYNEKTYYRHSGYPGGLKAETFEELQSRRPEEVIFRGVKGMLPQNKLRALMLKRLYVFPDEKHTYAKQLSS